VVIPACARGGRKKKRGKGEANILIQKYIRGRKKKDEDGSTGFKNRPVEEEGEGGKGKHAEAKYF